MTTAFVLSGGGSLGAVQVGMLQALAGHGIEPDLLVGTSVGAVNAAFVAGRGTGPQALDELAACWVGLRRGHVFPVQPARHLLALAGARSSVFSDRGLYRLVTERIPYRLLEDAAVPVHLVATDLLSGGEVVLSAGDAVGAVLASTAIPGLLPPVELAGRTLVDGGLANNAAISLAVELGADRVYVLPAGVACALPRAPSNPVATALHALSLLTQQRLIHDVTAYADEVDLHVLPPLCPVAVAPSDFSHAGRLISRARRQSDYWLDRGLDWLPRPERHLSLHHHPKGDAPAEAGAVAHCVHEPERNES